MGYGYSLRKINICLIMVWSNFVDNCCWGWTWVSDSNRCCWKPRVFPRVVPSPWIFYQVYRQSCCWAACQISQSYDHINSQSRGFRCVRGGGWVGWQGEGGWGRCGCVCGVCVWGGGGGGYYTSSRNEFSWDRGWCVHSGWSAVLQTRWRLRIVDFI